MSTTTATTAIKSAAEILPVRSIEFNHFPMTVIRASLKKHDHIYMLVLGIVLPVILIGASIFSMIVPVCFLIVVLPLTLLAVAVRRFANGRTGLVKFDRMGMYLYMAERQPVLLPWQALRQADLKKNSNRSGWSEARLYLSFAEDLLPTNCEQISLCWMKPGRKGERVIDIDLKSVAKRDHLKLISVLTSLLPPRLISKNLTTFVSPLHNPSFTELWSESLMMASRRTSVTQLSPGDWLNNYRFEIVSILGAGGQGTAYEAIDHYPVHQGALRVVLKEFVLPLHGEFDAATSALAQVQQEAQIIGSLDAEFAVKFYDLFVEDSRAYLVREFVDGLSLKELVDKVGALTVSEVLQIGVNMCEILEHLHSRVPPIVHRDFTPDNLLLNNKGKLKLIDFDIARYDNSSHSNQVVGKPNYLSPEQFRGQATAQSDIYSLGATLFFLSTGRQPMPISTSHPKSFDQSLSDTFDAIVAMATEVDCGKRYHCASVVREELINLLEEHDATL